MTVMTAGVSDRAPRRSASGLLAPLAEDRRKLLPRVVAAACENSHKDGFPPDVDSWAWCIGLGAEVAPSAQKTQASCGAEVRQSTPAKLQRGGGSRGGQGWHQLAHRTSAQHPGHGLERPASVPQDLDVLSGGLNSQADQRATTASGFQRRMLSTPNLAPLSQRPGERAVERGNSAAERAAALLTKSVEAELPRERCVAGEVTRISTPGWVPPSSRGSLASRQSVSRSNGGRHHNGTEREARRRIGPGIAFLGKQQRMSRSMPQLGPSLPAAAFFDLESAVAPGKYPSRSPSLECDNEPRCSIDDETSIPKGLFDDFLKAGKEARCRGQHYLDKKRPGHPRLVNMGAERPPPSRSSQRPIPCRSPPCGSRGQGATFGGQWRTPQTQVTFRSTTLEGACN